GILIGPFTFPIAPVEDVELIRLLAELGLVILLFTVGLEFGWRRIRQVGAAVLLIGSIEILLMLAVGYQIGRLLGWTSLESIFLGAAMSISSSAILVKVLIDTGRLTSTAGRLIVGILVVEDFAAVILLTLLAGINSTGIESISAAEVGTLMGKLAIFGLAALAFGALIVHRLVKFAARFNSLEVLMLVSLALCFSLALLGQTLGLSAAAGAFLIGASIGDTEEAESVTHAISPIRDMFGAVFFVSIGMLIDIYAIPDTIIPALVVSGVFIVGKMLGNTTGTFLTGRNPRTSLRVGMGMTQPGEFSLAMVSIIGGAVYQVVATATLLVSIVYPYIARSSDNVIDFLKTRIPRTLHRYLSDVTIVTRTLRVGFTMDPELRHGVGEHGATILVNLLIIVVLVAIGTVGGNYSERIAGYIGLSTEITGTIIGSAALALSLPSAVAIWRNLRGITDDFATYILLRRSATPRVAQTALRDILRDTVTVLIFAVIALWSIPLIGHLLSLGALAAPVPIILLVAFVLVAYRSLRRIHGYLVSTFSATFLGGSTEDKGGHQPLHHGHHSAPEEPAVHKPATTAPGTPLEVSWDAPTLPQPTNPSRTPRITASQAEIIALSTAQTDLSPYKSRMRNRLIVSKVKEVDEYDDYFKVTLTFRAPAMASDDVGEEEVFIDKSGDVRARQIVSWPFSFLGLRRVPVGYYYALAVILIAAATFGATFLAVNTTSP
ncbi:MAG: cation:proton antiporter, partial [Chloroflexi bacterium]|nr:cation:proton antiporter [Chloroflexota bacterium]